MIDLKKETFKLGLGILYIMCLLFTIRFFDLEIIGIYFLLLSTSTIISLVSKKFKIKQWFINAIVLAIILTVIYYLSKWIGGIWGFIVTTSLICVLIFYTRRKKFVEVKQHIESMVWGKPLKEYIEKGEKPPKIIIER